MDENKKKRIGNIASAVLIIAALIADLFSLIPFVGDFVGPIFWIGASVYFWKSGLGLVNGRRLATSVISMVAELIPGVQEFPTIVAGMIIIVAMTRVEDKTGISLNPAKGGKLGPKANIAGTRMPPPQMPLNQGGIRPPKGGLVK